MNINSNIRQFKLHNNYLRFLLVSILLFGIIGNVFGAESPPTLTIGLYRDKNTENQKIEWNPGEELILSDGDISIFESERSFYYDNSGTIYETTNNNKQESSIDEIRKAQYNLNDKSEDTEKVYIKNFNEDGQVAGVSQYSNLNGISIAGSEEEKLNTYIASGNAPSVSGDQPPAVVEEESTNKKTPKSAEETESSAKTTSASETPLITDDKFKKGEDMGNGIKKINGEYWSRTSDGKYIKYKYDQNTKSYVPIDKIDSSGNSISKYSYDDLKGAIDYYLKNPEVVANANEKLANIAFQITQDNYKDFNNLDTDAKLYIYQTTKDDSIKNNVKDSISRDIHNMDTKDINTLIKQANNEGAQDILEIVTDELIDSEETSDNIKDFFETVCKNNNDKCRDFVGSYLITLDGDEQTSAVMDAIMGYNCDGTWNAIICSVLGRDTEEELFLNDVNKQIEDTQHDMMVVNDDGIVIGDKESLFSKNKKPGEKLCDGGSITYKECETQIRNYCKGQKNEKSCLSEGLSELETSVRIPKDSDTGFDDYNTKLVENYVNTYTDKLGVELSENQKKEIKENCKDGYTQDCESSMNAICNGISSSQCDTFKTGMNNVINQQQVSVNWWVYNFMDAIKNPDQGGLKAAQYFGFEKDFSNLPGWLTEDFPSTICRSKINGYLDKEISGAGTSTKYGCQNDLNKDPSNLCLQVFADLRAQRTEITPDNKTLISYSYYLRAPLDTDINYVIVLSYLQKNVIKKEILIKNLTVEKEETASKNDIVNVILEKLENVDEESFIITLGAFEADSEDLYLKIDTPVLLATPEEYTLDATRIKSNSIAVKHKNGKTAKLTSDDLYKLMTS